MALRLWKLPISTAQYICSVATTIDSIPAYGILRKLHLSSKLLSGHSKWSTIKHKKAALDDAKMVAHTKIAARITVAVKCLVGGPDPKTNPRLSQELEHAKAENMTKETIERAIGKGEPRTLGSSLSSVTYEVMLPGGIAMVIDAMTDNKARTATTVKGAITPVGGALSKVLYQFQRKGIVSVKANQRPFDQILEELVEIDIEDIQEEEDGVIKVTMEPEDLSTKANILKDMGYEILEAETAWVPLPESALRVDRESTEGKHFSKTLSRLDVEEITGIYSNVTLI